MDEQLAQRWLKGTLKGELDKRGMTYADLARRLTEIGVEENERNLRNKIARGTFSAVFFVQCLEAIGVANFRVDLLDFMRSVAKVQHSGEPELVKQYDGSQAWELKLQWSRDRPRGDAEVIMLPADEFPDREGELMTRCGSCNSVLLRGWNLEAIRTQFAGESVVGRCADCGAYNQLPGATVRVS